MCYRFRGWTEGGEGNVIRGWGKVIYVSLCVEIKYREVYVLRDFVV